MRILKIHGKVELEYLAGQFTIRVNGRPEYTTDDLGSANARLAEIWIDTTLTKLETADLFR